MSWFNKINARNGEMIARSTRQPTLENNKGNQRLWLSQRKETTGKWHTKKKNTWRTTD